MPSNGAPSRVGVDIGGTFTDIVLAKDGKLFAAKILTTPEDPSVAVLQALDGILRRSSSESSSVGSIVHATTLVANAITERKGATYSSSNDLWCARCFGDRRFPAVR